MLFVTAPVCSPLSCADDEHLFRRAARIKSCAANAGDLAQLPWESALFRPKELATVSQTVRVPAVFLEGYKNCRDAILKLCGSRLMTLVELMRMMGSSLRSLQVLDRP